MPSDIQSLKNRVLQAVRNARDRMLAVSIFVHSNPELGYQEFKASARLIEELHKAGYTVTRHSAGLETAFVATLKGPSRGQHIAILAEYDALPEIDQAGGHNLISGAAVGTALALGSILNEVPGQVSIIGCPAEQGYPKDAGGKIPLIEAGVFDSVDVAMMIHPSSRWDVWSKSRAREHFRCEFTNGSSATKSAKDLVNPLDGTALSIMNIKASLHRNDPTTVVQYVISDGGVTPNVIPSKAEMKFYVRTLTLESLEREVEIVQASIRSAADTLNLEVTFSKQAHTYADTIPNLHLCYAFQKSLLELGIPVEEPSYSAAEYLKGESRGATDLGNVSRVVPAGTMHINTGYGGLHTIDNREKFIAAARSDEAHTAMMIGAEGLALTAVEFLTNPTLAQAAKQELEGYRANQYLQPYPTENYPNYLPE